MRGLQRLAIAHAACLLVCAGCGGPSQPEIGTRDTDGRGGAGAIRRGPGRRPSRRRHRRAVVRRGCRHQRRPHRRHRRAGRPPRRPPASTPAAWSSRPASSTCSASPSSTCSSTTARASKMTQGITTEITGEGGSIAPVNDRMIKERQASYEHFGVDARLAHARRVLPAARAHAVGASTSAPSSARRVRDYVDRQATIARPPPQSSTQMKALVAQAMEDGALGVSSSLQYVPEPLRDDRRAHRAGEGRGRGTAASTSRTSAPRQHAASTSLDEVFAIARAREHPRRDLAPQDRVQGNWGSMPEVLAPDRGGARARSRRARPTCIPTPRLERARRLPAAVGARRRHRHDARAAADPATRAASSRTWTIRTRRWENQSTARAAPPGVMRQLGPQPELRKYEGKTLAEIGKAHGQGRARRPLRLRHRRPRPNRRSSLAS